MRETLRLVGAEQARSAESSPHLDPPWTVLWTKGSFPVCECQSWSRLCSTEITALRPAVPPPHLLQLTSVRLNLVISHSDGLTSLEGLGEAGGAGCKGGRRWGGGKESKRAQ